MLFTSTPVDESKVYPLPWKDTHGYLNSETNDYSQILREKAHDHGLSLIESQRKIDEDAWMDELEDGVHPDTDGHEHLYRINKKELEEEELIPEEV